jgi:hypothetical protein
MPHYYVEGLYVNKQGVKQQRKTGVYPPRLIEPYARTVWANNPKEAIQLATAELDGGEWTEQPKVSQKTEEQRMRSLGAPEFPGLDEPRSKTRKPDRKGKL